MLNELSKIAIGAGEVIMQHYRAGVQEENKQDGSPVTVADKEAELYIARELKALWPDIPMIGEESPDDRQDVSKLDRFWCVDPLDGTREFINGSGEFTVNIALVENGLPTVGVIYAPAKDLLYFGDQNLGSFKSQSGELLQKLPLTPPPEKFTVTISRSHPTKGEEEVFLESLASKFGDIEVLRMGSSLKFCMVAEGTASLYFRAGTTMYWDSAAGHVIAKAAGASVGRWCVDEELTYKESHLTNPSFMVYWGTVMVIQTT